MGRIDEAARSVAVAGTADVLVAGGGPAGVAAAVAAARAGARTVLIEAQGCLGGVWTSGCLCWLLDHLDKGGLMREILARLAAREGLQPPRFGGSAHDPEVMKLVLEELCAEAGVRLRLHTRVAAAQVDADGRLAALCSESAAGREAWTAAVFVDATGNGDLAAQAGCAWELGRSEADGAVRTQPMSLLALLAGPPAAALAGLLHDGSTPYGADSAALLALLARQGVRPSYGHPILCVIRDGFYGLMANHQYGASGLDADQLTAATVQARAEVHRVVDALRAAGGACAGLRLVATAAHIGVREGRRIRGRYRVEAADLAQGRRWEDAVCRASFPVDIHATDPRRGDAFGNGGVVAQPYDIPLRALIAADRPNLLLAGRCISGDFTAHASYRVTGDAVALGEAAGACAALAAARGGDPGAVPLADLRRLIPYPGGGA